MAGYNSNIMNFISSVMFASSFSASVEAADLSEPQKLALDPEYPITTMCQGGQQFTVARDNAHGSPVIPNSISRELPRLSSECGVKHLILEYGFVAVDGTVLEEAKNLVDRINVKEPAVAAEEIMGKSYLFESRNSQSPMERQRQGEEYASMLVNAMQSGIKVHFAGDTDGFSESFKMEEYDRQLFQLSHDFENNPENRLIQALQEVYSTVGLEGINAARRADGLTEDITEEALFAEFNKYNERFLAYNDEFMRLTGLFEETRSAYLEKRFSNEALENRAERFICLANGENALIVWGGGHFDNSSNSKDIDEYLDEKLAQIASENGQDEQPVLTKQIAIYPTRYEYGLSVRDGIIGSDKPDITYFAANREIEITSQYQNYYEIGSPNSSMPEPKDSEPVQVEEPKL